MSPGFKMFLARWVVTTLGVVVAANVVTGIRFDDTQGLLIASLVLGILNAILRPIMIVLALPLLIVTLGLFTLVINAGLLYFVGYLVKPFHVEGFWPAFWGALVISIVSIFANAALGLKGDGSVKVTVNKNQRPPSAGPGVGKGGSSSGPVIDV